MGPALQAFWRLLPLACPRPHTTDAGSRRRPRKRHTLGCRLCGVLLPRVTRSHAKTEMLPGPEAGGADSGRGLLLPERRPGKPPRCQGGLHVPAGASLRVAGLRGNQLGSAPDHHETRRAPRPRGLPFGAVSPCGKKAVMVPGVRPMGRRPVGTGLGQRERRGGRRGRRARPAGKDALR